jgi:hypothetical protein
LGLLVLINLDITKNVIKSVIQIQSGVINEMALILGWVGIWEGITNIVDFVSEISKNRNFFEKIENAQFKIMYY